MENNSTQKQEVEATEQPQPTIKKEKIVKTEDLAEKFFAAYGKSGKDENKKEFTHTLQKFLKQLFDKYECLKYNILILHDYSTLLKSDADNIYKAIKKFSETKPILLILLSRGGEAGSAYLIGKLCREHSNNNFIISIPRFAKSAATLLCCAADEIHMGDLSELGPIDPQIDEKPALALKNSIEHIATLVNNNPSSSDMFAKYLNLSIPPVQIGYYERVAESAKQYAENLLETHTTKLPSSAADIASALVYKYKDHGFVIDKKEAEKIFGAKIIKTNTNEYKLGNELYETLDFIRYLADALNYSFYYIGSTETDPTFTKKPN
ncbi:MAG: hypothetical protein PHR36_02655 [Patescibacteria group bacterium]|nr:hypothetical protein [Patescibacteria group bacterium]